MYYVKWSEKDIDLASIGIAVLLTEISANGSVSRELGLNEAGVVVHKCPSDSHSNGTYGHMDLAKIETSDLTSNFDKSEFERLWAG